MTFNAGQDSYRDLRDIVAERTRPILAWVGSGLSADAGLPTWPRLSEVLIEGLRNKAESFPEQRDRLNGVANRAESEGNPWIAFEILRNAMGDTTFRDAVRRPFADAYRVATPPRYNQLWQLGIKGMLTLNLDRLAGRAMNEEFPGLTHIELSGTAVHRLRTNLSGPRPIVANLHGIFEDTETWVLTHKQLSTLLNSPTYSSFIDTCASMFTILFVGISVDDIAVGGHLERLTQRDVEFPTAFWITDRREVSVDRWAEAAGVRVIRYAAPNNDHSELAQAVQDLKTYVPRDAFDAPPVHLVSPDLKNDAAEEALPPEQSLLAWDAEALRQALNARASTLLRDESAAAYGTYEAFSHEYDQAIYRAWYTSATPGKNQLLGYTLEEHVARGAFGLVYRARSADGAQVAVKVLLDEVRRDSQALQSFRRGVRSMKILEQHALPGIASYHRASEIPAFVAMDWIEGPNLADAKASRQIEEWSAIVDIALQLVRIIRAAHNVPERVLHRDIRPENIMLRDFWMDTNIRDVVVLDFDLSWHVGAAEKSVLHTSSVGYLAPEQIQPIPRASTRSAFVDSFGIGMTLFFLSGGREPVPDEHRHSDWQSTVRRACERLPASGWVSLPSRFERLIARATCDEQSKRWDLAEMERELQLLNDALSGTGSADPELLAEELAARAEVLRGYSWNDDSAEAVKESGSGLRLTVRADLTNMDIVTSVSYASRGTEDRAKLNRYIDQVVGNLRAQLRSAGWEVVDVDQGYADMTLAARITPGALSRDLTGVAKKLDSVYSRIAFDRL